MDMRRASISRRHHADDTTTMRMMSSPTKDAVITTTGGDYHARARSTERVPQYSPDDPHHSILMLPEDNDNDNNNHTAPNRKRTESYHRRAASDPFDAQEIHNDDDSNNNSNSNNKETTSQVIATVLPTFPRYPMSENRNKNCWGQPDVQIFRVRGPNYFADSKKVESLPYLLTARGVDLLLSDNTSTDRLLQHANHILNGQLRKLPTLVVNFQFPWGHMLLYFEVPRHLVPFMQTDTNNKHNTPSIHTLSSTGERTLAKWLQGDTEYKNERLKLVPFVAEGPWVVRNMVTGRPALIGKKLKVSYQSLPASSHQANVLVCTLDIGSGSSTAKRIVSVCRRYMGSLTVDVGFVIEAKEQQELPEQMMGSLRLYHPDPLKAVKLM